VLGAALRAAGKMGTDGLMLIDGQRAEHVRAELHTHVTAHLSALSGC
jgi:hypothetical protein